VTGNGAVVNGADTTGLRRTDRDLFEAENWKPAPYKV
jgi:hypothetical protein